jgi:hypothetical protein
MTPAVSDRRLEKPGPQQPARVHRVTLSGPAGWLPQTTKLSPAQIQLFKDCGFASDFRP